MTCKKQHWGIYSHQQKDRELLKATLKHLNPCGNSYCKYSEICRFVNGNNCKLQEDILILRRTISLFLKSSFNYKYTTNYIQQIKNKQYGAMHLSGTTEEKRLQAIKTPLPHTGNIIVHFKLLGEMLIFLIWTKKKNLRELMFNWMADSGNTNSSKAAQLQ